MNDAPLTFILPQATSRELRRMQGEREHPNGLSRYEIRQATAKSATLMMQLQSLVSNLRKPARPTTVRRTYSEPAASCSPQP